MDIKTQAEDGSHGSMVFGLEVKNIRKNVFRSKFTEKKGKTSETSMLILLSTTFQIIKDMSNLSNRTNGNPVDC